MCEVTRGNFADEFPVICDNIDKADFIAFDLEFSGLRINDELKYSLFDNGERRYQKLRQSVRQLIPVQIGIAAFVKKKGTNTYIIYSYNFPLFPASFGPVDTCFLCQSSSLMFLARHNFDFNKFVYEGVPFINNAEERTIRRHIGEQFGGLEREVDEESLQECCSLVAQWLTDEDSQQKEIPGPERVPEYVILTELRQRFSTAWPTVREDGQIIMERVSEAQHQELFEQFREKEEKKLLNRVLGFTRVFRFLTRQKKPVVGHNCLLDLLMMYDKFHEPLPPKFSQFKENICKLLPRIYDTKHIACNMRRKLKDCKLFEETSLKKLHDSLNSKRGQLFVLYSPDTVHGPGCEKYKDMSCPHEASFDAYMCGKVFLRMAHILRLHDKQSNQHRPQEIHDYLTACKPYLNRVNLIRGGSDHVVFDGPDPQSWRPFLYVTARNHATSLDSIMVARQFSAYGCVDVQMCGKRNAVVAVNSERGAEDIIKKFRNNKNIYVCRYSVIKHSPLVRTALWCMVALSGAVCLWNLYGGMAQGQGQQGGGPLPFYALSQLTAALQRLIGV